MSTSPGDKKREALREAERQRLSQLPDWPVRRPFDEHGVLLSNRIEHYCTEYQLVAPFDKEQLRPAAYALSVGRNFSIGGKQEALNDGMVLTIKPYQVAIIETYQTINMPRYLIGRWNIAVKKAYQGLLWVGGAQVDPGFRGYLCCPIYNLSTEDVVLHFRDNLAVIDFVTTTPYEEGNSLAFQWNDRKMLVFPEYPLLQSGIEAQVNTFKGTIDKNKEAIKKEVADGTLRSEESFRKIEHRIDGFVTLTFTVVAVLFAGLGIIATKAPDQPSFLNSSVWVAAIALYFALRAHVQHSRMESPQPGKWHERLSPAVVSILITGAIVASSIFLNAYNSSISAREMRQTREQVSQTINALEQEKRDVDGLREQIHTLQQNQSKAK